MVGVKPDGGIAIDQQWFETEVRNVRDDVDHSIVPTTRSSFTSIILLSNHNTLRRKSGLLPRMMVELPLRKSMHDQFWSLAGRESWYEPEPARMVFLGSFFVRLGEKRFGPAWDGLKGKPSTLTATPLQKEIAQAAASESIDTFVLNPKTYEFQEIARKGWRNPKSIAARFSRCRIDAADPANADAEGRHHGLIYVELNTAKRYLDAVPSPSHAASSTVSTDHLSTYLLFLIYVAQNEKIDEGRLGTAKALQRKIMQMWEPWRRAYGNVTMLPEHAVITDAMATHMAVLLRGERARLLRGGGVRKKTSVQENAAQTAT